MKRFAFLMTILLAWPVGSKAEPKLRTVKIYGTGLGRVVRELESIPCKIRLQGMLQERGYRLIAKEDPTTADLVITTSGACNQLSHTRMTAREHICTMQAKIRRVRHSKRFKAQGKSKASQRSAWSDGCLELTKKMAPFLGKVKNQDKLKSRHKWPKKRLNVRFSWKKGLTPMPLLKITTFFKKAGYQAKLIKSGSTHCRFKVSLEEAPEQFESLLRTYLGAQYELTGHSSKGGLSFKLTNR
ncbi:MAG: hypothetical protein JRF33_03905 [Deltaproteobacteria bacterium]|nr:hypothetical protein [Deltaproteobacteria bacterium]